MKKCSSCGKDKALKCFKNSGKTIDGKFPFCKGCEYSSKILHKFDKHNIAYRMFRELVELAQSMPVGKQNLYMNRDLFEKWCYNQKDFDHYVSLLQSYDRKECKDLHIKIIDREKHITFDNIFFIIDNGTMEQYKYHNMD